VKQPKNRAELKLVSRAFRLIPAGTVLDAPCGGRVGLLLANKGYQMRSADLAALNATAPQRHVSIRERVRFLQLYNDEALNRQFIQEIAERMEHLLGRRKFADFRDSSKYDSTVIQDSFPRQIERRR